MDATQELNDTTQVDDVEENAEEQGWGRLVSLNDQWPNALLTQDTVLVGRAASNTVVVADKSVSSRHCKLTRSAAGTVHVEDTSTNGSFVNKTRIAKGVATEIHAGDELCISAADPNRRIAFVFQSSGGAKRALDETQDDDSAHEHKKAKVDDAGTPATTGADGAAATATGGRNNDDDDEEVSETLLCCICREIMHDCVSILPCLHNFCAACLSSWLKRDAKDCPQCRGDMQKIGRNHQLSDIIEAFLKKRPSMRRDSAELKEMDAQNTITSEMLRIKSRRRRRRSDSYSNSDNDYSNDDDEDDDEEEERCQQCPGVPNRVPGYVCSNVNPRHLQCSCCSQLVPDRRADPAAHATMTCCKCAQVYCNPLFVCRCRAAAQQQGRSPCLTPLKDVKLSPADLATAIVKSRAESARLVAYLASHSLDCTTVFQECLDKVQSGEYSLPLFTVPPTKDSLFCRRCAVLHLVPPLFYQYRERIKKSDITQLPDCWYGIECRTMTHSAQHADRYNHICPIRKKK